MSKDELLTEQSTKQEIVRRFNNARHVMDDLCLAYYGMTWAEHERLHGKEEKANERTERNQPGDC